VAVDIAELGIRVNADGAIQATDRLDASLQRVGKSGAAAADQAASKMEKWRGSISGVSAAIGVLAGSALLRSIIKNTIEAEAAFAQLQAAVRSTGGAAGFTADQLKNQASALQLVSNYGDEAVQTMQSILLTFPKIKGENFEQASVAVLDLATRMGGDLRGAAVQLGKALQDPTTGLTALTRSGVSFSAQQKQVITDLVDTGRTAEAQRLILAELEVQFGGSAKAARETLGGSLTAVKNALGDAMEATGAFSTVMQGAFNGLAVLIPKVRGQLDHFVENLQLIALHAGVFFADFPNKAERAFGRGLIATGKFAQGLATLVPGMAGVADKLNEAGNAMIRSTIAETAVLNRYRDEVVLQILGLQQATEKKKQFSAAADEVAIKVGKTKDATAAATKALDAWARGIDEQDHFDSHSCAAPPGSGLDITRITLRGLPRIVMTSPGSGTTAIVPPRTSTSACASPTIVPSWNFPVVSIIALHG